MNLTFLGTGNAFAPERDWGCVLVNDTMLLDAGPSLLVNLKRLRMDAARISHIFLTHFHGDHFFGLPFLLLEYYFLARTDAPLAIVGPPGVEDMVTRVFTLAYPDVVQRGWPRPMHFMEAQPGAVQTIDGVTFTAVEMDHGDGALRSFGYRLRLPDGILAYTGDTRPTPALDILMDGARALIVEADSHDTSPVHLGREALRALLARVPAGCQVILTHLDTPGDEPWRDWPVIVAQDLQTYTIPASSPGIAPA